MTATETPRNADGDKLCAWCGGEIKQSGVGRSRDYCSRTHREYAYRQRRDEQLRSEARIAAYAKGYARGKADAAAWSVSSTGGTPPGPVSSTGESRRAVSSVDETRPPAPMPPQRRQGQPDGQPRRREA